jgi:hypothetical protein
VVGIATDHCVRATALDAARHGFTTRVLLSLTAGVHPATTTAALDEMRAAGVELAGAPLLAGSPQDGTARQRSNPGQPEPPQRAGNHGRWASVSQSYASSGSDS